MSARSETAPTTPGRPHVGPLPLLPVVAARPGQAPSLQALQAGELHLWHVSTAPAAGLEAVARLLPEAEARRAQAFPVARRRTEDLVTRALVRWVLSSYLPAPPQAWRFRAGPHGRPELADPSPLRFNLSHGEGLVACLVAHEREVGVDVEPWAHGADADAEARAFCSPEERQALQALPEGPRQDRALTLWTLKEAYAKARGLGFSLPVAELTFLPGPGALALLAPPALEPAPGRWRFASFELGGHRAAVAAGPGDGPPPARLVLHHAAALGAEPPHHPIPGVDSRARSKWADP